MYLKEGKPVEERFLSQLTIEELNRLYQSFAQANTSHTELEDEAREVFRELESGNADYKKLWEVFREITLEELRKLYSLLEVEFDEFTGESFYIRHADDIIKKLELKGLVSSSRGTQIVDLSEHDLPPLMLRKSDGTTLYATRDLCAAVYRKRHFKFFRNLYVVDNGQSLHFRQFFKVLELMGYDWAADCRHIPFGLILTRSKDGKWEKGKTRAGGVSLLKDVIEGATKKILEIINEKNPELGNKKEIARKIAIGALVFNDLKNKRQNDVNFDWDAVLSFEGDTGPYVINAYVRLCSILRKGEKQKKREINNVLNNEKMDFSNFREPESSGLIKALSQFPEKVQTAMEKDEPAVLAQYSLLLAEKAHKFIHACRVLGSPEELERLCLVDASRIILRNTLELIGIPLVEKM
jgi:arginyl-tRNA synthetase